MDISADFIQNIAQLLTPLLPYLLKGGKIAAQKAFEEAGKKLTDSAWEQAEKVFEKIKKTDSSALDKANRADEKQRMERIEAQIKFLLEDFPELAKELQPIIIHAGDGGVNIGGSMTGGSISIHNGDVVYPPDSSKAEVEQLKKDYLQWLYADAARIPLRLLDKRMEELERKQTVQLQDIYIDLHVRPLGEKDPKRGEQMPREKEERQPLIQALKRPEARRAVVVGEAGSGKSTFANYMMIMLAAKRLGEEEKQTLTAGLSFQNAFPIRIVLRETSELMAKDEGLKGVDILWNVLREDLKRRLGAETVERNFSKFKAFIKAEPCLIVLDGLDEVSLPDQRRRDFLEAIVAFGDSLCKESLVIVTTRPYTYNDPDWMLNGFETLNLLPLDEEQIETFVSGFYESVQDSKGWDDTEMASRRDKILAEITGKSYLLDIAQMPLRLTLICAVDISGSSLPNSRAELYEKAVDLLLVDWEGEKKLRGESKAVIDFFSNNLQRVREAFWKLAYNAHEAQRAQRDSFKGAIPPANISEEQVWGVFGRELSALGANIGQLVNFLENRSGLLLSRGGQTYVFPHRSFQEYLAARHLIGLDSSGEKLCERLREDINWWREVALLGFSHLRNTNSSTNAAQALSLLVPKDYEKASMPISDLQWRLVSLAGESLAELNLPEDDGLPGEIIRRAREWLTGLVETGALDPQPRAEAGNVLAKLGDPRSGVSPLLLGEGLGVRSDFLFCEIPAGKFMMGSKKDDKDSSKDEYPQFEYNIPNNYFMSRYPITNAQFDLFVKDENGYRNKDWWTEAGLEWRKERREPDKRGGVFDLPNHPVMYVRWYEAAAYCKWLTQQLNQGHANAFTWNKKGKPKLLSLKDQKYEVRLPSEAEWEYAARAGTDTPYSWGEQITPNRANYSETGIGATSAVGLFPDGENKFGLLDMSGNVWEWCVTEWQDSYKDYVKNEGKLNKAEGSVARVLRGGSYDDDGSLLRCAVRSRFYPSLGVNFIGIRVVARAVSPISP